MLLSANESKKVRNIFLQNTFIQCFQLHNTSVFELTKLRKYTLTLNNLCLVLIKATFWLHENIIIMSLYQVHKCQVQTYYIYNIYYYLITNDFGPV